MDNKINDIIKDYVKSIQEQILKNKDLITEISVQIENCRKVISQANDPTTITDFEKFKELSEANYTFIKKCNEQVKEQEKLIIKFYRFSSMIINDVTTNDIPVLEELLGHYESEEDYERCSYIRDLLDTQRKRLETLKKPFDRTDF